MTLRPVLPLALLLFSCAALASGPAATSIQPADAPGDDAVRARIEAYLRPFIEADQLSGSLLVTREGRVLIERSFGMADFELGVPNDSETRFCVASITKPMTIAVVSQLAEGKKLSIDDPVAKWIPDFPRAGEITIGHLLNHRAGIPHRVTTEEEESQPTTPAEMVERVKKASFLFEPGEKSIYSSAGYSVLARIIELVEGKDYGEVLDERIFRRAGMARSLHSAGPALIQGRAPSYLPGPSGIVNAPLKHYSFLAGAGSVFSTARDLHSFIDAVVEGKLGEAARAALLREEGVRWNGITNGYRVFADYHAATKVAVVFTGNVFTGAADFLRDQLPALAAGAEVIPPPPRMTAGRAPVAEDVLRRYEGLYRSDRGQEFTVSVRDGNLYSGDRYLIPTSETTFFAPQDYSPVTVVMDESGRVLRLDWNWKGQQLLAFHRISDEGLQRADESPERPPRAP